MGSTVDRNVDEYMEISGLEVWKDIKGYEGIYKISTLGRVKSCDRGIPIKRNFNGVLGDANYHVKSKIIAPGISKKTGHYNISLIYNGKRKTYSLMRLVYCTFNNKDTGKYGFRGMLEHIDGNKNNNKLSNIRPNRSLHLTERSASYKFLKEIGDKGFNKDTIYDLLNKIENKGSLIGTSIGKKALDTENLILDFLEEKNIGIDDEDDMNGVGDFTLLEFFTRIQKMKVQ